MSISPRQHADLEHLPLSLTIFDLNLALPYANKINLKELRFQTIAKVFERACLVEDQKVAPALFATIQDPELRQYVLDKVGPLFATRLT